MHKFGFFLPGEDVQALPALAYPLLEDGFNWVEVGAWAMEYPPMKKAINQLLKKYQPGVSLHCHFEDVNPSAALELVRSAALKRLKRDIDLAADIGAELVVMHAGDIAWFDYLPVDHPDFARFDAVVLQKRKRHIQVLKESLNQVADYGASCGVRVTVENMYFPWELVNSPQEAADVLRHQEMHPNLGFTLDYGHALVAGYRPEAYAQALGDRVWHTHIHDNDGIFDLHAPLGTGCLELDPVICELHQSNPDITFLLELPLRALEPMQVAFEQIRNCLSTWENEG